MSNYFHPNSKIYPRGFFYASVDKIIRWGIDKDNYCSKFETNPKTIITCIKITRKGDKLVSSLYDGTILIWDVITGLVLKRLESHFNKVTFVAITSDDINIVSCSADTTIKIWNMETGVMEKTLAGHERQVTCVAITPRNDKIVSASDDNTIKIWDFALGILLLTLSGHTECVGCIVITSSGQYIISGSKDETVRIWNICDGSNVKIINVSEAICSIAVTLLGDTIVCGCSDNNIHVYDFLTGGIKFILTGHCKWVTSVSISPDEQNILSCSWDGTMRTWDLISGTLKLTVNHVASVQSIVYCPDSYNDDDDDDDDDDNEIAACMKNAMKMF